MALTPASLPVQANCYPQLVNKVIQGIYHLDSQGPTYRMDLTVSYPYVVDAS